MLRLYERQIWLLKLNRLCQLETPLPRFLGERGRGDGGQPQFPLVSLLFILLLRPLCRLLLPYLSTLALL